MLPKLRFGFDPLESSNEPLRGWGHPEKSRLGGWRTELLTSLEQIEALRVRSCEGLQKVVLDAQASTSAVAGACASVP
jgi:hypothetical protein